MTKWKNWWDRRKENRHRKKIVVEVKRHTRKPETLSGRSKLTESREKKTKKKKKYRTTRDIFTLKENHVERDINRTKTGLVYVWFSKWIFQSFLRKKKKNDNTHIFGEVYLKIFNQTTTTTKYSELDWYFLVQQFGAKEKVEEKKLLKILEK